LHLRSNSPFQKMEILNGELKLNDLPGLNVVAFDFLVDNLYRGFFNLSVGLVVPRTHSSAEHLINELTYLFDRSLGEADEFVGRALVAGVGGLDEAQQMVQQAQTVLNHQARAG